MLQFHYQQGSAGKLALFPHILELSARKNTSIQLHSFPEQIAEGLCIYFIQNGKFEWKLNGKHHYLFPGDTIIILPDERFGNEKGILELGSIYCIQVRVQRLKNGGLAFGKWSCLSDAECAAVSKLLQLNDTPVLPRLNET